jgi:hypothetical protein
MLFGMKGLKELKTRNVDLDSVISYEITELKHNGKC